MTAPSALRRVVPFVAVWIGVFGVWELLVQSGTRTGMFMPAPSAILSSLGQLIGSGLLITHLLSTLFRISVGLLCGAGVGLLVGIGMGTSVRLRRLVDPVVAAIHPIPRLAFFPLLIVAFGVGEYSKTAAVALGAFFPMVLNTVAGIRGMNPVHLELARNYGATRWQMFTRVLMPGSMPLMLTGVQLSSNAAFHATIGVEMVGSRTGIGSLLWLSWQTFRIDQLYAILGVIAVLGISLSALIRWIGARAVPWQTEARAQ